jgi:hypothetical protein
MNKFPSASPKSQLFISLLAIGLLILGMALLGMITAI